MYIPVDWNMPEPINEWLAFVVAMTLAGQVQSAEE